jgi:hypothetical protein
MGFADLLAMLFLPRFQTVFASRTPFNNTTATPKTP